MVEAKQPPQRRPAEQAGPSSEEELDRAIRDALDCPCVAGLRQSPCGELFVNAFTCFHKSKAEPKGYECYDANVLFAECISKHPEALDSMKGEDGRPVEVPPLRDRPMQQGNLVEISM